MGFGNSESYLKVKDKEIDARKFFKYCYMKSIKSQVAPAVLEIRKLNEVKI